MDRGAIGRDVLGHLRYERAGETYSQRDSQNVFRDDEMRVYATLECSLDNVHGASYLRVA